MNLDHIIFNNIHSTIMFNKLSNYFYNKMNIHNIIKKITSYTHEYNN